MKPQEILFWVIVGIIVGAMLIMVADQLLLNMLEVNVTVRAPSV